MATRIMSRFSTVLICAAGIALCVFAAWYNAPAHLGKRGEERVTLHLRNELPENILILNDLYLPLADGSTTQIDHIVISECGIFVIETKTYSGWIFGRANDLKWTQTIYRKKSTFQNPIRQNALHINTIAKTLGIPRELLTGVVVFAGDCEFKTEMPPGVVFARDAAAYIRSFTQPKIPVEQIPEIAAAITAWQSTVTDAQRANHVGNLKKRHESRRQGK